MREMVERVAKAIVTAMCENDPDSWIGVTALDHLVVDGSFNMLFVAKNVVEAMREPTKSMREAGRKELRYSSRDEKKIYIAMLDDALK